MPDTKLAEEIKDTPEKPIEGEVIEPTNAPELNQFADKFPKEEYDSKIFNFTKGELQTVSALDVSAAVARQQLEYQKQEAEVPSVLLNAFISNNVLKRVGVKQNQDNGIFYDSLNGTITVYIPKVICAACENKKATKELNGKWYCDDCYGLAQEVQSPETPVKN